MTVTLAVSIVAAAAVTMVVAGPRFASPLRRLLVGLAIGASVTVVVTVALSATGTTVT